MAFVKTLDILKHCAAEKYIVGAFNLNGLDQPEALIKRAEELGAPLLITEPGVIEPYVSFEQMAEVTRLAARNRHVPVGLHLSHGDFGAVERAAKAGFTSVMYDGSKLDYEENIRTTREAVKLGHSYGVAVEGELGALAAAAAGGAALAPTTDTMTDPMLAKDYVKRTGVDILAVSIGNAHGLYRGKPSLDFQRLEQIYSELKPQDVYLTLHGGTGIPEDHIKRSMGMGIVKVCIYTDMCVAGKKNAKEYVKQKPDYQGNFDICDMIGEINKGFVDAMEVCMRTFSGVGRIRGNEAMLSADKDAVKAKSACVAASGEIVNQDIGPAAPSDPALRPESAAAAQKLYWHKNV